MVLKVWNIRFFLVFFGFFFCLDLDTPLELAQKVYELCEWINVFSVRFACLPFRL